MSILTVQHNGVSQTTNDLPVNITLNTIREQAVSIWPEVSSATILVNGVEVGPNTTVGQVPAGAIVSFRLPTGSKA